LRVCVFADAATGITPTRAVTLFGQTLQELAQSGLSGLRVDPLEPCPGPPLFLRTQSRHPQHSLSTLPQGVPPRVAKSEVAPYVLAVAITTPERITAIFGPVTTRRGTEQLLCAGDNCAEVTISIYMPESDVELPAARRDALLQGLGLAGRP
jgi:hypothetical protein